MPVISARIDDRTKQEAEKIAESIGLSLSSVINIFLNRFVAERGFPFSVTDPNKKENTATLFDKEELESLVIKAIRESSQSPQPTSFSYLDPQSQEIRKI